MRRDDDLIRTLLLAIEHKHEGTEINGGEVVPEAVGDNFAGEHLNLLLEAGLIRGQVDSYIGMQFVRPDRVSIKGLTWKGHEFLADIRSDTAWEKAKEKVAKVGGSVSLSTLAEVAGTVAKGMLGL